MKDIVVELRKLASTWGIMFTFWMLPDGKFKILYCKFLKDNLKHH